MNTKLLTSIIVSLLIGTGIGYSVSLSQISMLQSEKSLLESEFSTLTTDYNNLNTTYSSLNSTYYELQRLYEQLEEAYELLNTAGLVFDGLRISDLNVTKEWLWTSSTVTGNVTNTSNKTMSKVYVVLFTFEPDETLDYYYVRTVENLAVNENNEFEFSNV